MKTTRRRMWSLAPGLVLGATLLGPAPNRAQDYTVTDLGPVIPLAINNRGQVVGGGFYWDRTNGLKNLGAGYELQDINDSGQAVGWTSRLIQFDDAGAIAGTTELHAAGLAVIRACLTTIPDPFPYSNIGLHAVAINNQGRAVLNGWFAPVIPGGSCVSPHAIYPYSNTVAAVVYGMNNRGHVVGEVSLPLAGHAFFWDGGWHDLGTLGGDWSRALDVNDVGEVVGWSNLRPGQSSVIRNAFGWKGTEMRDLGPGQARAVNNAGWAVGDSEGDFHNLALRALRWNLTSETRVDLNTLVPTNSGWVLERAHDINELGQIVGAGRRGTLGQQRGFLLDPAPCQLNGDDPSSFDLALEMVDAVQPVQVVWQKDPGAPPDYGATDDMQQLDLRTWRAGFPMVVGKATRLFGYNRGDWRARDPIQVRVINPQTKPITFLLKVELLTRSGVPERELYRSPAPLTIAAAPSIGQPQETTFPIPAPIPYSPDPTKDNALTFPSPGQWIIRVRLASCGGERLEDREPLNNHGEVLVEARRTHGLKVLFQPFVFPRDKDDPRLYPPGYFATLNQRSWGSDIDFLLATFPIGRSLSGGDVLVTNYNPMPLAERLTAPGWPVGPEFVSFRGWTNLVPSTNGGPEVRVRLEALARFQAQLVAEARAKNDLWDRTVVLLPPGTLRALNAWGMSYAGLGIKKTVLIEHDGEIATVCHELGHSFGLGLPPEVEQYLLNTNRGGFPAFGYWAAPAAASESRPWKRPGHRDDLGIAAPRISFMGNRLWVGHNWIAKPDYKKLLDQFTEPKLDPEVLQISGLLGQDGRFEAFVWHRFNGEVDVEDGAAGSHKVELLDATGQTVLRAGFTPSFTFLLDYVGAQTSGVAPVAFTVPWRQGTARVRIVGPAGEVLAERAVSANAPTVDFTTPVAGERIDKQPYRLAWQGSDADGDALSYSLHLSHDGGQSWSLLAGGLTNTQYTVGRLNELAPGPYHFSVVATDGINTSEANVGPVTISPATDLGLALAGGPVPAIVTSNLVYTLSVTNRGTNAATLVRLEDEMPAGVPVVSIGVSQGGYATQGNVVTCDLGTLPAGATAEVAIVVGPLPAGSHTNTARLSAAEIESDWANNIASVVTDVPYDLDGDGIPDAWELTHGLLRDYPFDADVDSDGDGYTNLQEYHFDSDPLDPASPLRIASWELAGNSLVLRFRTAAGRAYRVEQSDSLPGPFATVAADDIVGTGGFVELLIPGRDAQPRGFFRIRLLP